MKNENTISKEKVVLSTFMNNFIDEISANLPAEKKARFQTIAKEDIQKLMTDEKK